MTEFRHSHGFNGTCAPLLYIVDCTPAGRQDYMNSARFWLAANGLALIAIVVTFIRRYLKVDERFNTLRLAMICFVAGLPFHLAYDGLRAGDYRQHNVPIPLYGFLFMAGFIPAVTGLLLLVVTWVSFSSKDLLFRPALTGHPALFWSLEIPFVVINLTGGSLSGISYWWYFITMRVCISAWAAFFMILSLFAGYYGHDTLKKLSNSQNTFNYKQQLRMLIVVVTVLILCAFTLTVQAYFLIQIDKIPGVFILVNCVYRVSCWSMCFGSAIYVWVATSYHVSNSSNGSSQKSYSDYTRSYARTGSVITATAPRNDVEDSSDDETTTTTSAATTSPAIVSPGAAAESAEVSEPAEESSAEEASQEREESDAKIEASSSSSSSEAPEKDENDEDDS